MTNKLDQYNRVLGTLLKLVYTNEREYLHVIESFQFKIITLTLKKLERKLSSEQQEIISNAISQEKQPSEKLNRLRFCLNKYLDPAVVIDNTLQSYLELFYEVIAIIRQSSGNSLNNKIDIILKELETVD